MGNSPRDCGPGGQWLGFILSGGELLSSWGVVLEPSFLFFLSKPSFLYELRSIILCCRLPMK